jgi:glycosyltransferase involved in cell wall biosynthesis
MRIGLLVSEARGGIGRHVASLVPRYAVAGHEVLVCCPADTAEHFGFDAVQDASALRGCDVVHAHGYKAGLAARRARLRPLVVTWHNAVLTGGVRGLLMRFGQRAVARSADLTLGASSDLVELARRYGARDARLAPVAAPSPPASVRPRDEVRAELGVEGPLVLSVGRLAPQKDFPVLLDVARAVREATYVVVGEGPLRDELQAAIDASRLAVRLVGHRSDVPDLLGAADVFLLTSRWEARALVVQEAMQAGVPVVARRVGGIPELVGPDALLGSSAAELAAHVATVLRDPALAEKLAVAGRQRAATWPDEDDVAADLLDTYTRLIASAG